MLTIARLPCGIRSEFLDGLTENARTGRRERMPQRNAAAIRVHAVEREAAERMLDAGLLAHELLVLQRLDVTRDLRRERLVDFPQRNVVEREPMPRQQPRDRG